MLPLSLLTLSAFSQVDSVEFILYREQTFKGSVIQYEMRCNGSAIGKIKNGTVIVYKATAGLVKFEAATETSEVIFIDALPGETYYVRCSVTTGWLAGRPTFRQVSKEQALKEIEKNQNHQKK
ncbi:MAG: hypothetical protein JNL17_14145 [Cyclobacteriaceae bacterium]|nr:hypothetical protein [Cyclobacteriaceae bacterium]